VDFVNAAAFSPDGTLLATAPGSDGEIVLQHWPARTEPRPPFGSVPTAAASPSPPATAASACGTFIDSREALRAAGFAGMSLPVK